MNFPFSHNETNSRPADFNKFLRELHLLEPSVLQLQANQKLF